MEKRLPEMLMMRVCWPQEAPNDARDHVGLDWDPRGPPMMFAMFLQRYGTYDGSSRLCVYFGAEVVPRAAGPSKRHV